MNDKIIKILENIGFVDEYKGGIRWYDFYYTYSINNVYYVCKRFNDDYATLHKNGISIIFKTDQALLNELKERFENELRKYKISLL